MPPYNKNNTGLISHADDMHYGKNLEFNIIENEINYQLLVFHVFFVVMNEHHGATTSQIKFISIKSLHAIMETIQLLKYIFPFQKLKRQLREHLHVHACNS